MQHKLTGSQQQRISALSRRLLPLQITGFFQGFVFWYTIEKAFMETIGFNAASITVATSIYIVVMMLANFPIGIIADRWSRKGILYIASLMLMVSSFICGISHGFWLYVVGISIWGLFYACYSGTYDSIIYDTVLEENALDGSFETQYGRLQVFDSFALIIGALVSSFVASHWGLRTDYFLTIPSVSLSLLSLKFFREPTLHKQAVAYPIFRHVGSIMTSISHNLSLKWLVAAIVCNVVAMRLIFEFLALWLIGLKLPIAWFGPATALFFVGMGAGGYLAQHIRTDRARLQIIALLALFTSVALVIRVPIVVVVGMALLICGLMMINIITSRYLHDAVSSAVRVGASSLVSSIGYTLFVPVAICFGFVSRDHTVFRGGWFEIGTVAAICLCLVGFALFSRKSPDTIRGAAR